MPFDSWSMDLIEAIADKWHWSHREILKLPLAAAFHYAMRAERRRWQSIDDAIIAASFAKLEKRGRQELLSKLFFMLSGPGREVRWEDTLTERERAEVERLDRVTDELYQKFREQGILCSVNGAPLMESVLKRSDKR